MHQARAPALLVLPDHLVPDLDQEADVALQLGLGHVLRDGTDDEAGPGRAEPVDDLPQAAALLLVGDPAADAHVVHRGHEDQMAAGNADVRGEPSPLGADGVLGDLHHHLLAHLEEVLDAGVAAGAGGLLAPLAPLLAPSAVPFAAAPLLYLSPGRALSLLARWPGGGAGLRRCDRASLGRGRPLGAGGCRESCLCRPGRTAPGLAQPPSRAEGPPLPRPTPLP